MHGLEIVELGQVLIKQALSRYQNWTVDEVADQLGISAAHFHRLLKRHLGVTPKEFARRVQSSDSTTVPPHSRPLILAHVHATHDLPRCTGSTNIDLGEFCERLLDSHVSHRIHSHQVSGEAQFETYGFLQRPTSTCFQDVVIWNDWISFESDESDYKEDFQGLPLRGNNFDNAALN